MARGRGMLGTGRLGTVTLRAVRLVIVALLTVCRGFVAVLAMPAQTVTPAPTGAAGWTVRPEWVRAHESFLASDVLGGRGSATHDEELAAAYVASEFEGYGLTLAPGMTEYLQRAVVRDRKGKERQVVNAVGYLPGTEPGSGTLLLTAHLDHLGVGKPVHGDAIYNGANDDAAGTTAVLELAHALAAGPKLRRGVLFVCYGGEEIGEIGSTYFGNHPPVPLTELVANLEFEMIGLQDPRMPPGVLLFTGWERSDLGPVLKEHGALLGPDPYPEQHFFERSDNYSLALRGVVAHTAAGWGTPPTYHQPDDDLAHLDLGFLTTAIQSLVEPLRWLAESKFVPVWHAGGQPQAKTP